MQHPLVVEQLLFMLKAFLPRIGAAELAQTMTVDAMSDTEHSISLGNTGICIDTGYPVPVPTLDDKKTVDGYRVYTMEVQAGGRMHPDETVDVTRKETPYQHEVLTGVGTLLAQMAAENLPDLPPELVGTTVVEEAR